MARRIEKTLSLLLIITLLIMQIPLTGWTDRVEGVTTEHGAVVEAPCSQAESPIVGELTTKREANVKHFLKADLSCEAAVYPMAVHYRSEEAWQDIDNTLTAAIDEEKNRVLENQKNAFKIRFSENSQASRLVRMEKDGYQLSWTLIDAGKSKAILESSEAADNSQLSANDQIKALTRVSSQLRYPDIYTQTDLAYELRGDQVKENLILKQPGSQAQFTFSYTSPGLTPRLQADGTILLADETGSIIYCLAKPVMLDSGNGSSEAIRVEISTSKDGFLLTLTPDQVWLKDPARVYPVTIDPTISTSIATSAVLDTYVSQGYPTTNYYLREYLKAGFGADSQINRTFIKFTLPALTSADLVIGANLSLYLYSGITGYRQVDVHSVQDSWTSSGVTWNNQPSYHAKIEDYEIIGGGATGDFNWDITGIAKAWYSSGVNSGLMLKAHDESLNYVQFYAVDTASSSYRPQVTLLYINNSGLENYWTYHSQDVGRAGTGYVNDFNGNLIFTHGDIAMSGNLLPTAISHVFNSNLRSSNVSVTEKYGQGWRLNLSQKVAAVHLGGTIYYKYTDGDGTDHYFPDGASPISEEINPDLKLYKNSDGTFTIKDKSDNCLNFSTSGCLSSIADNNGNLSTLNYSGGRLSGVTDGSGRISVLNYNASGYLSQIVAPDSTIVASFGYTGERLTSISYADANTTSSYVYDANGNLTSVTNYTGYRISYGYSGIAPYRVSSIGESHTSGISGNQLNLSYGYNATTFTDIENKQSVCQFDNSGKTVCVRDSSGEAQYYTYHEENNTNLLKTASKLQKSVINLAPNPGSEFDRDWYFSSDGGTGSSGFSSADKYNGNRSVRISKADSISRHYSQLYPNLAKGQTYTVSVYVKTLNVSNTNGQGACLSVHYKNSGDSYESVFSAFTSGTKDWQRIQLTFTLPADSTETGAIIRMNLQCETGTAYFDDVQVEAGSTANRYNLIENGDFSGSGQIPSGWSNLNLSSGEGLVSTTDDDHPQALDSSVVKVSGEFGILKGIDNNIFVSGSQDDCFVLSCWAKGDPVPSGSFTIGMAFISGTDVSWKYLDFNRSISSWQYVSGVIIAPINFVRIDLYVLYYDNANSVYLDGLQLFREEFGHSYTYDSSGNVTKVSDLAGNSSTFAYNGSNNLMTATDPKGNSFAYAYDGNHNLTQATSAENVVYSFTYDTSGNPLTSKVGDSTTYILASATYTSNKNYISTMTDSSGNTVTYNYNNSTGLLDSVTDASGKTTSYDYDSRQRLTGVSKTVDGQTVSNDCSYENDQLHAITHNNFSYQFNYDLLGNHTTVQLGEQTLITNTYEQGTSKLLSSAYGNGQTLSPLYDGADNVLGMAYSGDNPQSITYSGYVQDVGQVTVSGNNETLGTTGQSKRLETLSVTLSGIPAGMHIQYRAHVQDSGWQGWAQDGATLGTTGKRMEAVCIRLTGAPDGYTVQYQVHVQDIGWLDPVQDGQVAGTLGRNLRIEAIRVTVVRQRTGYLYNASGNLGVKNDFVKDVSYHYTYDLADRLSRIDESNGNELTYAYDQNNNVSTVTDKVGGTVYATGYSFDKDNRSSAVNYTRGANNISASQTYDSLSRLQNRSICTGSTTHTTSLAYRDGANGSKTTLVSSINNNGATISYTYDSNGNIAAISENGVLKVAYFYNEINELKRENNKYLTDSNYPAGQTITYAYDAGGNLTSKKIHAYTTGTPSNPVTIDYGYDSVWKDKLTSYDGAPITYDAIGNPLTYGDWTMTWAMGRQLAAIDKSGMSLAFTYNDEGIRTAKTVNGVTTSYHLVGDKVTFESNGTDSIYYTYDAAGDLLSMRLNGTEYFYIRNAQGDVIGLFNTAGTQVVGYLYDSWGKPVSTTGSMAGTVGVKNPYRYRGYRYDAETGLFYVGSRYYDPEIGRFINADTTDILDGGNDHMLENNLFAYCFNNPVNMTDEDGQWPKWATKVLIGVAVIAAVAVVTVATGGAGAGVAGFIAAGAFKGAVIGAASGAVIGGGLGAVSHRVSTGSWKGAGNAALNGAADGFMTGAISGAITGGAGRATQVLRNTKVTGSLGKTGKSMSSQSLVKNGKVTNTRFYNAKGKATFQLDYTNHGYPRYHSIPHGHSINFSNPKPWSNPINNLWKSRW